MRQFQFRVGYENFALIHVSLVPDMHGEQKTKPTQTTVHALRGLGLLPDLVRRSRLHLLEESNDTVSFNLDCLSSYCSKASGARDERENFHVLPCLSRASHRSTRRFIGVPCPIVAPVAGDCSVLTQTTEPR